MFFALLILLPLMFLYSAFSWGYVLFLMYHWFVLSAMPTLPHFTIIQMIGLSLTANVLIRHSSQHIKSEYKDDNMFWTNAILSPWITLFITWAFHALYF